MKIQLKKAIKEVAILLFVTLIFLNTGCQDADFPPPPKTAQDFLNKAISSIDTAQLNVDLAIIDDSLAMWGLTGMILTEPHGVRYKIDSMGTGVRPNLENTIRIKYSGKLLSTGEEFDASESIDFILRQLIIGFQTTLPLLPKGTVVTLYIPSGYGYGPKDIRDNADKVVIPGNSNLIFDIELLDVF